MKRKYLALLFFLLSFVGYAQQGRITGVVKDINSNAPVPFANVIIYQSTIGAISDTLGRFEIGKLDVGFARLQVSSLGYETYISEEFYISHVRNNYIEIKLNASSESLQEIKVTASPFKIKAEAPVSLRSIGIDQIEKSAGANRDISRVLQSFPGVGSASSFRNDLFVRGGGPSENRYYIDGIEIPNLNHFATQGASGGPVGILNVDFIREVDFYSSAFPVSKANALSSVFDFKQIDVQNDKPHFKGTIGASEMSLTSTAPISEKTGLIASVRRSYLQFLFEALELPFLPTFTDFQFKTRTRIDAKNELTLIGVGAIDRFKLNLDVEPTEENNYILDYLPVNNQWNYTIGAAYKHFFKNSYVSVFLSRNHLNNQAYKYQDNIENPEFLLIDYSSDEIENKFRVEYTTRPNKFTINLGAGMEYVQYQNSTFDKTFENGVPSEKRYESELDLIKWAMFGSVSHPFIDDRLTLSLGLRVDGNSYSDEMNKMWQQFSPRFAASYNLAPDIYLNMNVGRYYQKPAYTTLGFRNNDGELVNMQNGIRYLKADHFVGGLEYRPSKNTRVTLEGFYKLYDDYPFSVNDSISIASKGGDFGVFGDEEVLPTSKGKAYGAELLVRTRTQKGVSLIAAYTYVRSEFTNWEDAYIPSSWDSRHLFTFTGNKQLGKNWDLGVKWRFVGGLPYTPYDYDKSSLVLAWDAQNRQYLDYSQFNTLRLDSFHQLDLRVDKTWYLRKMSIGFYIDIQNVYNQEAESPPELIQVLDDNGMPIIENPGAPIEEQRYRLKELSTTSGTVLPTIGLMIEF